MENLENILHVFSEIEFYQQNYKLKAEKEVVILKYRSVHLPIPVKYIPSI